jgi:sec-independent protein translocase protein TatA
MFGLGIPELIVILVVVVVAFGPSRLPQLGQALGSSIKGFKNASREEDSPKASLPGKSTDPVRQEPTTS